MSERNVKDIHVDRETEKRLFGQMLQGEADAHILLIQADSGLGKSSLLREFREMSQAFPTIVTDLKLRHTSEGILFDCCFRLGPANFTRFHGVCQQILGITREQGSLHPQQRTGLRRILSEQFNLEELALICFDLNIPFEEIRGDTISRKAAELILLAERTERLGDLLEQISQHRPFSLGDMEIGPGEVELTQLLSTQVESKLSDMDRDQRLIYRRMLTAAFFDDLRQLFARQQQHFVFMFDTFNEEIIAEVKEWVSDFLKGARMYPWLVVVVAGQRFPTVSFDDRETCYRHVLLPFEPQDVHEFARQADVSLEPKDLDLIYGGTNGVPLLLATILDNLRKRRGDQ